MGRHTSSIVIPFKYVPQANEVSIVEKICKVCDDGGTQEPIKGWTGVGWACDIEYQGKTVYATAVAQNVPLNDDGEAPADYDYPQDKVVYFLEEGDYEGVYEKICFFAYKKSILVKFLKDMGLKEGTIIKNAIVTQTI